MSSRLRLFLVRHGQSHWNAAGLLQGQSPHAPGLNETGREQAALVAAELAGSGAERVLTSDLTRAVETAIPIAEALGVPVELEPRLRERSLGVAEGRPVGSLGADAGIAGGAVTDPEAAPPGGESLRALYGRLGGLLEELKAGPVESAVLVSHGWSLRIAHAYLVGEPLETMAWPHVPNASVHEVLVDTAVPARGTERP